MRFVSAIGCMVLLTLTLACKSSKVAGDMPKENMVQQDPTKGAITEGIAVNMDGTMWYADSYEVLPMGNFWMLKGTASDASVFSIMLPEIKGKNTYQVLQGGEVSVTYSTNRANGFLFLAPFSENNGWINTEEAEGYVKGTFEVTVNNGAISKLCKGMFSVKLPKQ